MSILTIDEYKDTNEFNEKINYSFKRCASYLNERISSPSMKEFIFDCEDVGFRSIQDLNAIHRLICAQFFLVYLKWLNSSRKELSALNSLHYKKVNETLSSLYSQWNLDVDLIVYVLSEAQKDVLELGEKSFFADVLEGGMSYPYGRLYGYFYSYRTEFANSDDERLIVLLSFVLKQSKGIATAEWDSEEKFFILNGKKLLCGDIVYESDGGSMYVLKSKNFAGGKGLYEYVTLDGIETVTVIK